MDGGLGKSLVEILAMARAQGAIGFLEGPPRQFDGEVEAAAVSLAQSIAPGATARWLDLDLAEAAPAGACAVIRFDFGDHARSLVLFRDRLPSPTEADRVYSLALLVTMAWEASGGVRFRLEWPTPTLSSRGLSPRTVQP